MIAEIVAVEIIAGSLNELGNAFKQAHEVWQGVAPAIPNCLLKDSLADAFDNANRAEAADAAKKLLVWLDGYQAGRRATINIVEYLKGMSGGRIVVATSFRYDERTDKWQYCVVRVLEETELTGLELIAWAKAAVRDGRAIKHDDCAAIEHELDKAKQ